MSLSTVIKIGKLYRESPSSWQYHDQVKMAMNDVNILLKKKDREDRTINTIFYLIPVVKKLESYEFKMDKVIEIQDEDKKAEIYYLNFKTSKKDSEKRYLIGDIVYSCFENKKGEIEENGNYRMAKDKKASSFYRCEDATKTINDKFIQQFRNTFRKHSEEIESLLKRNSSVVLHFDFEGKRWIDFEGITESIDNILTDSLIEEVEIEGKYSLRSYLYKTLGGPTPGFNDSSKYKNRLFFRDEIISLLYASKASEKPTIRINSIGIIALPHSDRISALDVVSFFERNKEINSKDQQLDEEEDKEADLYFQGDSESDSLFGAIIDNNFDNTVKFDIVFTSIPGSPAGVFYDLIEISNIEKSLLVKISDKIRKIKLSINNLAINENPDLKHKPVFDTKTSFLKILGDVTKAKKKFQLHLLKTLPKIYTDTYYNDPVLLPAFIEKVEYNIRNNAQGYSTFKYNFFFLLKIQKTDVMTQITNSQSYALGQALGTMARPFAAWRDDCPIKTFEKSYVGNLTRRITSIADVTKFADFLNQKLTIHERAYKNEKDAFLALVNSIKNFQQERYNKHYCSLGFFESYYASFKTENTIKNINTEKQ